jgi:uncharacterized coiled-coil protein SlyX
MTLDDLEDYYREEHGYTTEDLFDSWEIGECHKIMSKRIKELESEILIDDEIILSLEDDLSKTVSKVEELEIQLNTLRRKNKAGNLRLLTKDLTK